MTTIISNTADIDLTNAPESIAAPFVADFNELRTPKGELAKQLLADLLADKASRKKGGLTGASAGRRKDSFSISPYELTIRDGFNAREVNSERVQKHIDTLARSIAARGVKEPLTVFVDGSEFVITNGECRLRAVFRAIEVYGAKVEFVPVKTEDKASDEVERLYTQNDSNMALPFSMIENGYLYRSLVRFGQSEAVIATRTGRSITYVNDCLTLLGAPAIARDMVQDGTYKASTLLTLLKSGQSEAAIGKIVAMALEEKKATVAAEGGDARVKLMPRDLRAAAAAVEAGEAKPNATARMGIKKAVKTAFTTHRAETNAESGLVDVNLSMTAEMYEQLCRMLGVKASA